MNYISYHVKDNSHLRLVLLVALEVISVVWFLIAETKNLTPFQNVSSQEPFVPSAGKRVTDRLFWFLLAEIKN